MRCWPNPWPRKLWRDRRLRRRRVGRTRSRRYDPCGAAMHLKTVPDSAVDRAYRRHRRSAYAGIFAGYAAYYLVRNNLALAIPDILKEYPQHSKADLGWALTGLSIAYGIS